MAFTRVRNRNRGAISKRCCFSILGSEKIDGHNLEDGVTCSVFIDIDAHEYNGKWFNSIKAYKVEDIVRPSVIEVVEPVKKDISEVQDLPF
jgi:hypothetical protein